MVRTGSRVAALALAGLVTVAFTTPAWAPADMFLKLGDIRGEAAEAGHDGWITVLSLPGLDPGSKPTGPGRLVVVKRVDKATPKLQEAIAKGKLFPSVVLSVPTRERKGYLKYTLEKVKISSYSVSGSGRAATETISLIYEHIEWE